MLAAVVKAQIASHITAQKGPHVEVHAATQ
jgi:hypothetical protein